MENIENFEKRTKEYAGKLKDEARVEIERIISEILRLSNSLNQASPREVAIIKDQIEELTKKKKTWESNLQRQIASEKIPNNESFS